MLPLQEPLELVAQLRHVGAELVHLVLHLVHCPHQMFRGWRSARSRPIVRRVFAGHSLELAREVLGRLV